MSTTVEILVTDDTAERAVASALGAAGKCVLYRTTASTTSRPLLFMSFLAALETLESRMRVAKLLSESLTRSNAPRICFIAGSYSRKAEISPAGAQALALFCTWAARSKVEPYVAPDAAAAKRIVNARKIDAERELIASASLEGDKLVVWSCEPRRYEISVAEIPSLATMKPASLAKFEVSSSGSRIRWPDEDVDLDLETILERIDPNTRQRNETRARQDAMRYAKAIRSFREEAGLRQMDIKGLTDRQVRRLESGKVVPRIESLRKLAGAHGLGIKEYMNELAARSSTRSRRA